MGSVSRTHSTEQTVRRCSDCNARLNRYNSGTRCHACDSRSGARPLGEADRDLTRSPLDQRANEVLEVAGALLAAKDDPRTKIRARDHGVIAAAFATRFMVRTMTADEEERLEIARRKGLLFRETDPDVFMHAKLSAQFRQGRGRALPYIQLKIEGSTPPSAELIVDWYRRGPWKRWQHRLWDGREDRKYDRKPGCERLIRGWALYAMKIHADLGLSAALDAWNNRAEQQQRPDVMQHSMSHASKERSDARKAADKLRSFLSRPGGASSLSA